MLMLKSIAITAGLTVASLSISAPVYANGNSNAGNKVTICHATGSKTNPYVRISPNANGVVAGHEAHQDQRDIIPSFHYNDHGTNKTFPGQNWNSSGQAVYNNGCKPVSQPTVTPGRGGGVNSSVPSSTPVAAATPAEQITAVPQGAVNAGYGEGSKVAALFGLVSSLGSVGFGLRFIKR
jgi:hypothetical protein